MFFFHKLLRMSSFQSLCASQTEDESSFLLCFTAPRWLSQGNSSHFMPDRKSDATPTHAYILMSSCIEFLFIPFLCYFFPRGLSLRCRLVVLPLCHDDGSQTLFLVPPKLFSANGNLQYCMLKPSGCCWWPVVGRYIWELLGWKGKKACFGVNKWKTVEKRKLL